MTTKAQRNAYARALLEAAPLDVLILVWLQLAWQALRAQLAELITNRPARD